MGTASYKGIGQELNISSFTVRNHLQNIKMKLEDRGYDLLQPERYSLQVNTLLVLLEEGELILKDPNNNALPNID